MTVLFTILCSVTPVWAENDPAIRNADDESQELLQKSPLKTYFLSVLAGGSRQFVKLNPPATKVIVFSQVGNKAVRCGDSIHTYDCLPGNPLKISVDKEKPIEKFWAENPHEEPLRLRINVYEALASDLESKTEDELTQKSKV
ncbi:MULTISPECIES: hypothetical protein [unclassified Coleofasciculus]|uniref:hypothetical protein n=1 Tax=unclassified Coleofasciculus TaxID=2692782 RepID=UPI00187FCEF1|nr:MULTISPECIES: hypothetical protein [unclassified Coleofasciculus]MBE9129473.1 hypothetical protein [Coleofasciculus sp. LEGE 07081]MBE9152069.1 hypothetical protein [Coleofasciculus sp. LEGE 07092]